MGELQKLRYIHSNFIINDYEVYDIRSLELFIQLAIIGGAEFIEMDGGCDYDGQYEICLKAMVERIETEDEAKARKDRVLEKLHLQAIIDEENERVMFARLKKKYEGVL